MNSRQLVSDFYTAKPLDAVAWMDARDQDLLRGESVQILEDLYFEAGWLGWCTAAFLISKARGRRKAPDVAARVDWGGWVPGDADAARKLLGDKDIPGLQDLLDKRSVTIKGIEDTRYKDLASILARGVANGDSMETVAGEIVDYLKVDADWADTVARTETRSAVTQASLDSYRDASISQKEWLTAWDEACDICSDAQDMGPIPIDEDFGEAGDGPPGHPNCLCVVLPVIGAESEEVAEPELTEVQAQPSDTLAPRGMPYKLSPSELNPGWDQIVLDNNLYDRDKTANDLRDSFAAVAQKPIEIAINEQPLVSVLNEGRFKSVFEMPDVKGGSYLPYREEVETNRIGVPSTVDPSVRPIYGAINNTDYADGYGSVKVVLNEDVKDRASMCVGDSFGGQNPVMIRDVQNGTASMDDLARSVDPSSTHFWKDYSQGTRFDENRSILYWEVQVHGGVSARDIAEVVLPRSSQQYETATERSWTKDLFDALRANGIPWRYKN